MMGYYLIDEKIVYNIESGDIFELNKSEVKIKLSSPAAKCLQKLLAANHDIVSPDDLINDIWGKKGVIVGTNTLYQHIYILRKNLCSLGLDKNIIKTTPRSGFNIPREFTIELFNEDMESGKPTEPKNQYTETEKEPELLSENNELETKKPKAAKKSKYLYFFILVGIVIISSIYIYTANTPLAKVYPLLGQYKSCEIYGGSENLTLSYVNSRVIKREIACDSTGKRFLYYFDNKEVKRESIILCENSIDGNLKSNCKSFHWTGYED
ncbi:DNA-binding winged helix-turn-helix (wHTH) protein [Serratia fonticola]|uniref:DNA-binding winged helix-turn-helix (WHTH) protein n=1 Tax=Serratia fonticola TaxID=47917 RepID=A0A542CZS7_SERFO|nr:winged helix-turn-helix domain-containing protein [Serratia fonticola]TQI81645.1 DNA-binding winged helix-turn-helix (wHTH) protein [Serratia fonticola]TQI96331.1 DNA-binding winged helix-turn-helix (wHTH) protein [Serratia fonticola]TVZ70829.1 DNA-binding winged helix-turn-helix (wHTH) protein [Serratia fonticola]